MRRLTLGIVLAIASLLVAVASAQAVVVNMGLTGRAGVALAPGSSSAKLPIVSPSASCSDPWLSSDLGGPAVPTGGLCWNGGPVMHGNETFALTWDPARSYWAGTRNYVEQYLKDVADGSGTFASPYAVTPQYNDPTGRAGNASRYGGGCIDYGVLGGATCTFPNSIGNGPGNNYPPNGCAVTAVCLTDSEVQQYLRTTIDQMGLVNRIQPGYTPVLVLLTPSNVETCLDAAGTLCSSTGGSAAQFCSYHSYLTVGSTVFAYVVQPWTTGTSCDDPNIPALTTNVTAEQLATDTGRRLVTPLSQAQIAAIVNPQLNGWFARDGSEINDNARCGPVPKGDVATVGGSGQNPYYLQPAFSNAGLLESDPYAPVCALGVDLMPRFVVPSPIDQGDVVAFDGSVTVSSLMVPKLGYSWSFGDGLTGIGPSVVHSYAKGGTYTVTLTVTDRGGNVRSLSQTIVVLGPDGKPVSSSTPSSSSHPGLHARIQLMPQSLRAVLREGVAMKLSSNEAAAGVATLSISRGAARRAHIRAGRGPTVTIGRGTIAGVKAGTENLRLRLSRATAAKLARIGHTALTIRLALVAADGDHLAIVAAGHY
jgi:hypothetical protein